MNGNGNGTIALPHQPTRIGQATAIEQSRAAAEVYAAILVAQQCPRDVQAARREMEDACRMKELAEQAFYAYPKGGGTTVTGPTVHLARELARCWGNIQYGVFELSRDDQRGQSEIQAYAWDLEKNSRPTAIFVVPHMRDKKGGAEKLVDMRDIYENNANAGARRVRECLFAVLPLWYVTAAKSLCRQTLENGGGVPLAKRVADAIERFALLGISEETLAEKVGKRSSNWDGINLGNLTTLYRSIKAGELTREDAFPATTVTTAEITDAIPAKKQERVDPPADQTAEGDSGQSDESAPHLWDRQTLMRHMFALLKEGGIGTEPADRVKRMRIATRILNRPKQITSFDQLTDGDLAQVMVSLDQHRVAGDLTDTLTGLAAEPEKATNGRAAGEQP